MCYIAGMRFIDAVLERRYQHKAARRYMHMTPWRSCNPALRGFCLRCFWRDLTGRNRREKAAFIARIRKFEGLA